jgi:hypothetical protein
MPTTLTQTDRAALELALKLTRAEPNRAEQIEWKLKEDGWLATAMFASYHRQCDALNLCDEIPPCDIDDPDVALKGPNEGPWCWGAHEAARLVKRMMAHGISRFHPSPLEAIEAAKARRT